MTQPEKICWLVDLSLISFAQACELQQRLVEVRKARAIPDVLLLCEHPHVITLGRNAKRHHLLASNQLLAQMNAELHPTNRGGDITYHGPGQIVGYPILDLTEHSRDVRWYVEQLEEVMIRTTADFGIAAHRVEGQHGVWIDAPAGEEKVGAIGVHLSRWVTSHGFAYNVSTDLRYFDLIVPCGIADRRVTSLQRALSRDVAIEEVRDRTIAHFAAVFAFDIKRVDSGELTKTLGNASAMASV
ncbi:MAG TPA: lipoyl(octanoyl) transferase LipB [Candidatus Acidoferrales bacterium]